MPETDSFFHYLCAPGSEGEKQLRVLVFFQSLLQKRRKEGLHGAFAFPIILGGEVTGVMEFFSRGIHAPDDDLLSMLRALGTQIAKFIERERMADQLAQYTENC
jgi:GAF domain-containing protein